MQREPRIYGPYEHGDKFRVVVTTSGRRRPKEYHSFATRAEAERFIAGARDEAQGITVRFAIDAFLERQRERQLASRTIETTEGRLWRLLGLPGNGERPLRWLVGRGPELYAAARMSVANDTHLNALSEGRSWAKFCVARKWLKANPFDGVESVGRKRLGADKERHTTDEARVLRDWCHAHATDIGAVLTLAYELLGVRASELVRRIVRDLDDGGRLLWIGATKTPSGRRKLEVPPELQLHLRRLAKDKEPDDLLFGKMTRFVARNHVLRVTKAAGVLALSPQGLRRTQSSLATEAGATALLVAQHLGHASPSITHRAYIDPAATINARTARATAAIVGSVETPVETPSRRARSAAQK